MGQLKSGLTLYAKASLNGKVVQMVRTHSLRVFLNRTRTYKWQESNFEVYLKVGYPKRENNFGKVVEFCNEGTYTNKVDFAQAANAFINADTPAGTPEKIYQF